MIVHDLTPDPHVPFITNPVLSPKDVVYPSVDAGLPEFIVQALIYSGCRLIQMAGTLLGLPQASVARAAVLLQRFYVGRNGGSLTANPVDEIAAVCLLIGSKASETPIRNVRTAAYVFAFLKTVPRTALATAADLASELMGRYEAERFYVSEGELERIRTRWFELELTVMATIGFESSVVVPHVLCTHYLRILGLLSPSTSQSSSPEHAKKAAVVQKTWQYLNSALLSPQHVYLTHQPCAIATAAIYLAARQVGIKLPELEWWEVFDTDREELGFIVVAILSLEPFARAVAEEWKDRQIPLDLQSLEEETTRGQTEVEGQDR